MKKVDQLLENMLKKGGSDLHLSVGQSPKVRISGKLEVLVDQVISEEVMSELLQEITTPQNWTKFLEKKDLDMAHELSGQARFRANFFCNHWGMGAVFRQIPNEIASLEDLGLPTALKKICRLNEGLVLVTGPTGSGKSTSLAAMLDYINSNYCKKIITIEDPIEFVHNRKKSIILHREVGQHTHSFAAGLKSAFRSDPDILLIGEMRDRETMKFALTCAAMGMLVFATLHTNSAPKTIDRIVDAFPADEQNQIRVMLAESLKAVVSQLLARKKEGGRLAIHEILLEHEALPQTIRSGSISNIINIINGSREDGMISMDTSIQEALDRGIITPEEAYMKASDKSLFSALIGRD